MRRIISILCIIVLLMQIGCQQIPPPSEPTGAFTKDTYPRVDGSTVTIPLSVDLAAKLLNISLEDAQSFINHSRTHEAYVRLLEGSVDIILVTEPSEEELALAEAKGIELEIVPIVNDAFVFLINEGNPINSLSLTQIQDIYTGKATNWNEFGGLNQEIIAYQRNQNSGSQTLMESLVMKGLTMVEAPTTQIPSEMGMLIDKIAGYENSAGALGYSVYYYANNMYRQATIKFLGVNGVEPTNETIMKQEYPLTISYYAVLKKTEPQNSSARKLLAWLLSDDGQSLAKESGYVPLR